MYTSPLVNFLGNVPQWALILVLIWNIVWKGLALWKAGGNKQKYWFIALLVVNSLGILEIIYLLFFSKQKPKK